MDTSETYIKMCEKAEEIQKDWSPQKGDLFTTLKQYAFDKAIVTVNEFWINQPWFKKGARLPDSYIWLPRQDQLQEMVGDEYERLYTLLFDFCDFCGDCPANNTLSMEQLWLAFVMKEKYNKTWDGDKWI